jgi:hypothetical protein
MMRRGPKPPLTGAGKWRARRAIDTLLWACAPCERMVSSSSPPHRSQAESTNIARLTSASAAASMAMPRACSCSADSTACTLESTCTRTRSSHRHRHTRTDPPPPDDDQFGHRMLLPGRSTSHRITHPPAPPRPWQAGRLWRHTHTRAHTRTWPCACISSAVRGPSPGEPTCCCSRCCRCCWAAAAAAAAPAAPPPPPAVRARSVRSAHSSGNTCPNHSAIRHGYFLRGAAAAAGACARKSGEAEI